MPAVCISQTAGIKPAARRITPAGKERPMRTTAVVLVLCFCLSTSAAEVESRVLTHYIPQDVLEAAVRKEGWTEVPLKVKGGVRKGDVVRIWAGGSIDRGNGDGPGQNVAGPDGVPADGTGQRLALSPEASNAYALLFKTETGVHKARPAGKPL